MTDEPKALEAHVAGALASHAVRSGAGQGVVLAVSGGRDSVALLHAAARAAREAVRAVATFDHGTGRHAAVAVSLVREQGAALGLRVVCGAAEVPAHTEAAWRDARWRFLRGVARDVGAAAVATAHTRDDALETVVMRALRSAGARGLAALHAPSADVVRPFVAVPRAAVAAYAAQLGLPWIDDPGNASREHLRVRLRAELLPAVARAHPGAAERLLEASAQAGAWRERADAWAAALAPARAPVLTLAALGAPALAVFWPAFAARSGVRLDRRAIARLVAFTAAAAVRVRNGTVQPARVPVAGVPAAAVHLLAARDPYGGAARVWQLIVRADGSPERGSWHRAVRVA